MNFNKYHENWHNMLMFPYLVIKCLLLKFIILDPNYFIVSPYVEMEENIMIY